MYAEIAYPPPTSSSDISKVSMCSAVSCAVAEDERQGHGKAPGVRSADELFGIVPGFPSTGR